MTDEFYGGLWWYSLWEQEKKAGQKSIALLGCLSQGLKKKGCPPWGMKAFNQIRIHLFQVEWPHLHCPLCDKETLLHTVWGRSWDLISREGEGLGDNERQARSLHTDPSSLYLPMKQALKRLFQKQIMMPPPPNHLASHSGAREDRKQRNKLIYRRFA